MEGLVDLHKKMQKDVPQIQVEDDLQKAGRFRLKPGDIRRAAAVIFATGARQQARRGRVVSWSISQRPGKKLPRTPLLARLRNDAVRFARWKHTDTNASAAGY